MKYILFITLLIVFINIGCEKENEVGPTGTYGIRVRIQNNFGSDSASVSIDGQLHSWFANAGGSSMQTSINDGIHTLRVTDLNDQIYRDITFYHSNSLLFINADYLRTEKKINYTFSNQ
jgi:hypothetical protein